MNLHQRIISEILENPFFLESVVEIRDCEITPEMSLGKFGDLDLYVRGIDYYSELPRTAIVEVKAHFGLVAHYKKYQLPKYVAIFPDAKQFVVFSRSGSSDIDELVFQETTHIYDRSFI
jgi:hypothetical protein